MNFENNNKETKQIYAGLLFLLGLFGIAICLFVFLFFSQQKLISLEENRYQSYVLANQMRQSSDNLTRLVRTYAVTGNQKFKQQFMEVLDIRNGKKPRPLHYHRIYWDFLTVEDQLPPYPSGNAVSLLQLMQETGFSDREYRLLTDAQNSSNQLVELEQTAMEAMSKKIGSKSQDNSNGVSNQQMTIDFLFGEKYHQSKVKIMAPINTFFDELDLQTLKKVNQQAFQLQSFLIIHIFTFLVIITIILFLMRTAKKYHTSMVKALSITVKQRTEELEISNAQLKQEIEHHQEAKQEIKILEGLLKICANCKDICNDQGKWTQIEKYINKHSEADFTHALCPDCAKKLYPDIYKKNT